MSELHGSLRKNIRAAAKRFRRFLWEISGSDRYSHLALNDLDRKLAQHITDRNAVFIEAGANDGLTQSNTYWFERFRGWRGILIEPVPAMAEACRRNRPKARVVNAALVASSDTKTVRIKAAELMAYVSGSFQSAEEERRHLDSAVTVQRLSVVNEIEVPARTLSSILDDLGANKVDLFSLDVEGYEIQVLKGLDVTRHRPHHILVETKDLEAVLEALAGRYEVLDQLSFHDYLLRVRG